MKKNSVHRIFILNEQKKKESGRERKSETERYRTRETERKKNICHTLITYIDEKWQEWIERTDI